MKTICCDRLTCFHFTGAWEFWAVCLCVCVFLASLKWLYNCVPSLPVKIYVHWEFIILISWVTICARTQLWVFFFQMMGVFHELFLKNYRNVVWNGNVVLRQCTMEHLLKILYPRLYTIFRDKVTFFFCWKRLNNLVGNSNPNLPLKLFEKG